MKAILLAVGLGAFGAYLFERWSRRASKKEESVPEPEVRWYDASAPGNPFGFKVLDCRPITTQLLSNQAKPAEIAQFLQLRQNDGRQYIDKLPELAVPFACDLSYPCQGIEEGPVFRAERMEDKWDIYYYAGSIYFASSWSGELEHLARIEIAEQRLVITSTFSRGSAVDSFASEMGRRTIDFLIKACLFQCNVAHPIDGITAMFDSREIALSSFGRFGRRAFYASPEDTTNFTLDQHLWRQVRARNN